MYRPKTIICDIDGTLIKHEPPDMLCKQKIELLPGTIEKFREWDKKGYSIILITGKKESLRTILENQLASAGLFYNQLIMGVGGGDRILINDLKPNSNEPTAIAKNLERNKGIAELEI